MKDISIDTHLKSMMPKLSFDKQAPQSGFADMLTQAIDQTQQSSARCRRGGDRSGDG